MSNEIDDFNNRLKITNGPIIPPDPYSQRNQYTCSKIMVDSSNIYSFLRNSLKEQNSNLSSSNSKAFCYYFSINTELGIIDDKLRKKDINSNEFKSLFDTICNKYKIDYNNLFVTAQKIDLLKQNPDKKQELALCDELEKQASKYFEDKENNRNSQ